MFSGYRLVTENLQLLVFARYSDSGGFRAQKFERFRSKTD